MSLKISDDFSYKKQIEWWKAIIDSINDGILVIDHQGTVQLINPEYTKITGVTPEMIVGKSLRQIRPTAQLPDTLADGKSRVAVYRKEGNIEYMVDMAPIILNGEIIGAVSVCKSLTEVHKLSQELKKKKEKLKQLERTMDSLYQAKYTFDQIIGKNGGLREAVHIAKKAAETSLPVLIVGESGTGKELFAQAIHNRSDRRDRPFIPVNCAAIPSALLESELFGYAEGSFTHAKKGGKMGLFELANHGTIFLDEIGDMPYDLQAKLLRVLQERKVRRVGDTIERDIDVRVIAATNKDLQQLVSKNRFREDLFYRLNVIHLQIPPLRERREDIPDLIYSLFRSSTVNSSNSSNVTYSIDEKTLAVLQSYDWPGNVRELKNAIEYAICMAEETHIHLHHFPEWITKSELTDLAQKQSIQTLREATEKVERKLILETLYQFGNDMEGKKKAAEALGISLATLYNKIKKYKINS
ncbi:sigma-54 interaction domain-containing protein [Thermoflavimicrobium dichotomicum]|uniref:PAS domain S-box-containing protein n=1 Tax=Thermoflavimicrobium dichotomicum TaxID=46223 RepID=A0A1I3TWM7_9BACL|nr:sigma 54-interacting transcriptional regulator [Thermoflavimicrobium dichotomicum]SFJ75165.1 PAS domain S-box-containing protein [Thermoflavimicrobium dichotomicum]